MLRLRVVARFEARAALLRSPQPLHAAIRYCATGGARWTCPCGFHNYAFHAQCFRCNAARDGGAAPPKASPMTLLHAKDNTARASGAAVGSVVTPAEGVWMCAACNTFNNAERGACTHCGEHRPAPRRHGQGHTLGETSDPSHGPAARGFSSAKHPFRAGDWYCSCGGHNFARNTQCRECGLAAPSERRTAVRSGGNSGDWICRECGKYNFARRAECMQCHHPQPSLRGEEDVVKATKGPKSEGWVCSACHSMNPGDVGSACVICGSAK